MLCEYCKYIKYLESSWWCRKMSLSSVKSFFGLCCLTTKSTTCTINSKVSSISKEPGDFWACVAYNSFRKSKCSHIYLVFIEDHSSFTTQLLNPEKYIRNWQCRSPHTQWSLYIWLKECMSIPQYFNEQSASNLPHRRYLLGIMKVASSKSSSGSRNDI